MELEPNGFRRALRTSLTRPMLIAGVPRDFGILNATLGTAIGLGLQQPLIGLPLWALIQAAGAYASARDPWFLDTWPRAMAKPSYFSA